jgi:hypothetical protein
MAPSLVRKRAHFIEQRDNSVRRSEVQDFLDRFKEDPELVKSFQRALAIIRVQAGVEFDNAVAVSDDGGRIQCADYVVAYKCVGKRLKLRSYLSAAFLQDKIHLCGDCGHITLNAFLLGSCRPNSPMKEIFREILRHEAKKNIRGGLAEGMRQFTIVYGEVRVFFTDEADLPQTLRPPPSTQPSATDERSPL